MVSLPVIPFSSTTGALRVSVRNIYALPPQLQLSYLEFLTKVGYLLVRIESVIMNSGWTPDRELL